MSVSKLTESQLSAMLTNPQTEWGIEWEYDYIGTSSLPLDQVNAVLGGYLNHIKFSYSTCHLTYARLTPIQKPSFHFVFRFAFIDVSPDGHNLYSVFWPIIQQMKDYTKADKGHLISGYMGAPHEVSAMFEKDTPSPPTVDEVTQKIQDAQKKIDTIYSQINNAKNIMQSVKKTVDVINNDIQALQSEMKAPAASIQDLSVKYATLQKAIDDAKKALNSVNANTIIQYEEQIAKIEAALRAFNVQLAQLKIKQGAKDQINDLTIKSQNIKKEIQGLLDQLQVLKGQVDKTADQLKAIGQGKPITVSSKSELLKYTMIGLAAFLGVYFIIRR